jgi:selenocysteine lyase/cysteine desulfurase
MSTLGRCMLEHAVLGSLPLSPGDEVVITDLAYGAIALATAAVCERGGATLRTVHLEYPMRDAGDVVEPIVRALTPHTKLVVIDHVTAQTALLLPVAAVAAECRARGVPVLVDGAHVPGSRPLDTPSLGVDWYAAEILTERWRTRFEIPRDMVGTMVTVPLPQDAGTTDADAGRLRLALLLEERIEVQLHAWRGRLWARVSAQIYNDRLDIARLADAVARRTQPA